jgi:hypothetical protein
MVNISDFAGDVVGGDWAAAIIAAIAAIPNGGRIVIDENITTLSPVLDTATNYIGIVFQGDDEHTISLRPGISNYGLAFSNKGKVEYRDLIFTGYTGDSTPAECLSAIGGGYADYVIVDNCLFAGVYASRAVVDIGPTTGIVTRTKFGGCGGVHILADECASLTVRDVACIDYQNLAGSYYDRQGARDAWIKVVGATINSSVDIVNFRGDEGASRQVIVDDIAQLLIQNLACNLGSGEGMDITNVTNANLLNTQLGWTVFDRPALNIRECGDVLVRGMLAHNGPRHITTDRQSRTVVRNSPGVYVEWV